MLVGGGLLVLIGLVVAAMLIEDGRERDRPGADPETARRRAQRLAERGRWSDALEAWRIVNEATEADTDSRIAHAEAAIAVGRPGEAESALRPLLEARTPRPRAWTLMLDLLRIQERRDEALMLTRRGLDTVDLEHTPVLLRAGVQAVLTDVPDDQVRTTLRAWMAAEPDAPHAEIAYQRQIARRPRLDDPSAEDRADRLWDLVRAWPEFAPARIALVEALADAGRPLEARPVLEDWPETAASTGHQRIRGRWALEFEGAPGLAVEALEPVVDRVPHDWKSRYRLARALRLLGHTNRARIEARRVFLTRERLEPNELRPLLRQLDDGMPVPDLAQRLRDVGLTRLAKAIDTIASPIPPR